MIALYGDDDHVYERHQDGTWSPLEEVLLPKLFDHAYDRVTLAPNAYSNGCL